MVNVVRDDGLRRVESLSRAAIGWFGTPLSGIQAGMPIQTEIRAGCSRAAFATVSTSPLWEQGAAFGARPLLNILEFLWRGADDLAITVSLEFVKMRPDPLNVHYTSPELCGPLRETRHA